VRFRNAFFDGRAFFGGASEATEAEEGSPVEEGVAEADRAVEVRPGKQCIAAEIRSCEDGSAREGGEAETTNGAVTGYGRPENKRSRELSVREVDAFYELCPREIDEPSERHGSADQALVKP